VLPEQRTRRASIVTSSEFRVHVTSGNLPVPPSKVSSWESCCDPPNLLNAPAAPPWSRGCSRTWIYDADPKLGACLEVAERHGGHGVLEKALFAQADCVTATGVMRR
jgi:hypothetical protein